MDSRCARYLRYELRFLVPKARKGTRFGRDDGPTDTRGGKARLDIDRIIGTDRWLDDIAGTLARALADIAHGKSE